MAYKQRLPKFYIIIVVPDSRPGCGITEREGWRGSWVFPFSLSFRGFCFCRDPPNSPGVLLERVFPTREAVPFWSPRDPPLASWSSVGWAEEPRMNPILQPDPSPHPMSLQISEHGDFFLFFLFCFLVLKVLVFFVLVSVHSGIYPKEVVRKNAIDACRQQ